jgi:hypothetical protein
MLGYVNETIKDLPKNNFPRKARKTRTLLYLQAIYFRAVCVFRGLRFYSLTRFTLFKFPLSVYFRVMIRALFRIHNTHANRFLLTG